MVGLIGPKLCMKTERGNSGHFHAIGMGKQRLEVSMNPNLRHQGFLATLLAGSKAAAVCMATGVGVGVGVGAFTGLAEAQDHYDFSQVTALGEGAIVGVNVGTPVEGFDLLIMKDGEVVYHRAFGNWELNQVAAADSSTKTLSGALIMSLVDSCPQPFSLSTRLSQYIPAFSGTKQFITIRQAFAHTSGLANSTTVGNRFITLQQAALDIADDPAAFFAGTGFAYGGTSMHAAGAVAEVACGQSWNELFAARIAGPLGMNVTRFVLTTPANPRIAGGCESNASEFGRFMEMIRQGGVHQGVRVLSQNAVEQMLTRQTSPTIPIYSSPIDGSSDYGVGIWLDQRDESGRLIGALAAGARGFASWIDLDDGMTGVFATDLTDSPNVQGLYNLIRRAAEDAVRVPPACIADFNSDGGVDGADIEAFFASWEAGGYTADVNRDGGINGEDVGVFFELFADSSCG